MVVKAEWAFIISENITGGLRGEGVAVTNQSYHEYAELSASSYAVGGRPFTGNSQTSVIDSISLGFRVNQSAGFFLSADSLVLEIVGNWGSLRTLAKENCLEEIFTNRELDAKKVRPQVHCPLDSGVGIRVEGATQYRIQLSGASMMEWHQALIECESASYCPDGGGQFEDKTNFSNLAMTNKHYYYGLLQSENSLGQLMGNGTIIVGGARIALAHNGWIRLPTFSCEACQVPNNSTFWGTGEIQMPYLSGRNGMMHARMSGQLATTRYDEQEFLAKLWAPPLVGLVTVGTAGSVLLFLKGAAPLFTRLSKKEALEHPNRQKIFQYVQEHPGANFREIARNTKIPAGTVRHHLTVLERSGHLVEHAHNGTVRLFENHGKFDHNWSDLVLLREPPLAQVHAWLKEHPQSPQKDVLEAFEQEGWSRSTTQHRLSRLVEGGLVTIRLQGRLKIYSVAERVAPKAPFLLQAMGQAA